MPRAPTVISGTNPTVVATSKAAVPVNLAVLQQPSTDSAAKLTLVQSENRTTGVVVTQVSQKMFHGLQ